MQLSILERNYFLPYPDVESTLILDCDASNVAIGCALSQMA